jgi:hypothetical protein
VLRVVVTIGLEELVVDEATLVTRVVDGGKLNSKVAEPLATVYRPLLM